MSSHTDLIDRYIAAWNETDAGRRRDLIAKTWTENATYLDPMMKSEGHVGIDAMIAGVQAKFPGHRFSLSGKVDAYQDRVRFSWALAREGGPAPSTGGGLGGMLGGLASAVGGNAGLIATIVQGFGKLGLTTDHARKFVPVMLEFLESKVGPDVVSKLEKTLRA